MRQQNIKNLTTEKDGIKLLRRQVDKFFVPSIEERKFLYEISGIDYKKYSRSVDGVILKTSHFNKIKSSKDFLFIEIKTTNSKSVKQLPYGVFFGFTKNDGPIDGTRTFVHWQQRWVILYGADTWRV